MNRPIREGNSLILMLTTDRQIDRRTLQQADSLESAGWHVTIVAMSTDNGKEDDRRVVRISTKSPDIRSKNKFLLGAYRWLSRHMIINNHLMRFLKRFTWRYIVNQETFFLNLFSSTISNYTPRFVVAIDLPMLSVARTVSLRTGAKLIYDSHELYCEQGFSNFEKKAWKSIEDKHIRFCDTVITINPSIAKELENRYGIKEVKIIYNAEKCTHTPKVNRLFHQLFNLDSSKKILLFQGSLFYGRNIELAVIAMSHLRNTLVDLVILGDGALRHKLERLAKSAGVKQRIHFHDAVPQQQLLAYTQSADAGLIPYQAVCLNNYYCTPNKLFEFIAAGIPILASHLPEIEKIVVDHDIGHVGDMSTAKQFANLIDEFFSHEDRLHQWRENVLSARKIVCWQTEEKKLLPLFEG